MMKAFCIVPEMERRQLCAQLSFKTNELCEIFCVKMFNYQSSSLIMLNLCFPVSAFCIFVF